MFHCDECWRYISRAERERDELCRRQSLLWRARTDCEILLQKSLTGWRLSVSTRLLRRPTPPPEQDFDDNLEAAQAQLKRWWFRPDFSQVPFHEDAYIDDLLCQTTENERAFLCYRLFMAQWFWLWHYRTFDRNFR